MTETSEFSRRPTSLEARRPSDRAPQEVLPFAETAARIRADMKPEQLHDFAMPDPTAPLFDGSTIEFSLLGTPSKLKLPQQTL